MSWNISLIISILDKSLVLFHGLISAIRKKREQQRDEKIKKDAVTAFLDKFNPRVDKK